MYTGEFEDPQAHANGDLPSTLLRSRAIQPHISGTKNPAPPRGEAGHQETDPSNNGSQVSPDRALFPYQFMV